MMLRAREIILLSSILPGLRPAAVNQYRGTPWSIC